MPSSKIPGWRAMRRWLPVAAVHAATWSFAGVALHRSRRRTGVEGLGEREIEGRRSQALVIHDNVLQGLATAKLSFELGLHDEGMVALEETLDAARRIVSDLHEGMAPDAAWQSLRRPLVPRS